LCAEKQTITPNPMFSNAIGELPQPSRIANQLSLDGLSHLG